MRVVTRRFGSFCKYFVKKLPEKHLLRSSCLYLLDYSLCAGRIPKSFLTFALVPEAYCLLVRRLPPTPWSGREGRKERDGLFYGGKGLASRSWGATMLASQIGLNQN